MNYTKIFADRLGRVFKQIYKNATIRHGGSMSKHPTKCTCGKCLNDPNTPMGKRLKEGRERWRKRTAPLTEKARRSRQPTAADFQLRINT